MSRKLFLGGLTKATTTEQLFEVFSHYGLVVDAVVMERNGVPRGFGFVTFKDESSIVAVLSNRVKVDGREVDIKRAVPEEEMEFAPTKVFVGGLSQTVDRGTLKAHFEQYGDVRDAVVMMDRTTGRSRGFGFVRFAQPDAVERVLSTPQFLGGQCVDVKRAQPADSLPPPKYPRARNEDKPKQQQQQLPRRRRDEAAPELPAMDAVTAHWMASLLSMQQSLGMQGFPGAFPYPAYPTDPAYPAAAYPAALDFSGFDSMMPFPAYTLPAPELPQKGVDLHVDTEDAAPAPAPVASSPLGDLSNVLTIADGKSPTKTRASPQPSPANGTGENAFAFPNDVKSAMKEAGIASLMNAVFPA